MRWRKKIAIAALTFCGFLGLVTALDLWCETVGLPAWVTNRVERQLADQGFLVRLGTLRAGVFNGVRAEQVVWRDSREPEWVLLRADSVSARLDHHALLRGQFRVEGLGLSGGHLVFPGAGGTNAEEALHARDLNGWLRLEPGRLRLQGLRGQLGALRINARGDILLPPPQPGRAARPKGVTVRELVPRVAAWRATSAGQRLDALLLAMQHSSRAELEVQLRAGGDPAEQYLRFDAYLSQLLYQGLAIGVAEVRGTLTPAGLTISDLRLDYDQQESIHGELALDWAAGTLRGDLTMRAYPVKLLKIAAPTLVQYLDEIAFRGPPPHLHLTIPPIPYEDLDDWQAQLQVYGEDWQIVDAPVTRVTTTIRLHGYRLWADDARVSVAPDFEARADLTYDLAGHEMTIHGETQGDPSIISRFSRHEQFRRNMAQVWAPFDWRDGARPSVTVDMLLGELNTRNPAIQLQGQALLRGARYHGVLMERISASLFLDLRQGLLLVQDLEFFHRGEGVQGDLAYSFPMHRGDPSDLRFAFRGSVAPNAFMAAVLPQWADLLSGWGLRFDQPPNYAVNGYVNLHTAPTGTRVSGQVKAPIAHWREQRGDDLALTIAYEDAQLHLRGSGREVSGPTWRVSAPRTDLVTDFRDFHASLAWQTAATAQGSLSPGLALLRGNAGGISLGLRGNLTVGEWQARELHGMLARSPGNDWQGDLAAAEVNRADLSLRDARASGTWADGGLQVSSRAAELKVGDTWQALNLSLNLDGRPEELSWSGEIAHGAHLPSRSSVTGLTLSDGCLAGPAWSVRFLADDSSLTPAYRVFGLAGSLGLEGRGLMLTASAPLAHDLTREGAARGLALAAHQEGAGWRGEFSLGTLTWPALSLTGIGGSGEWRAGGVLGELQAERLDWKKLHLSQVRVKGQLNDRQVWSPELRAIWHEGEAEGSFFYDRQKVEGKATLALSGLQLAPLLADFSETPREGLTGAVNADTSLRFFRKEGEWWLFGRGDLAVRQGSIWKIPIIAEFLSLVETVLFIQRLTGGDWARITELSADFNLDGDRLTLNQARTDGTLVALSAMGNYWWRTGGLDLRVRAHLLEDNPGILRRIVGLIPNPFRPLLEYRLLGTTAEHRWERLTAIKDFISPSDQNSDPSQPKP